MASLTAKPLNANSDVDNDDDDVPCLSSNAVAALQEFLQEQQAREAAESADVNEFDQLRHVSEDWQLSQFWYTPETAMSLAREAVAVAGEGGSIACVSCPTLFKALMEAKPEAMRAVVLEFDRRFAKWGKDSFVFYDFKDPLIPELPMSWRCQFDLVVCDPPFLNEDCASATLRAAVETLGKKGSDTPIMFCTGEIMEETLTKLSLGKLKKSVFTPEHTSKLSNPFILMTNFETTTL